MAVRLEWRGGMFEEYDTYDQARRAVLTLFPRATQQPWSTSEDGNYRYTSFWEPAPKKAGEPLARILIPLKD